MAKELCREYTARDSEMADKHDMSALFRIGYGLYVVTSNDGKRDNGLIVNTVTQVYRQSQPHCRQHQQGQLFPSRHQADRHSQRELPVRGRALQGL